VRINALSSAWWEADARAAVAAGATTLLVPKADDPAALAALDGVLAEAERAAGIAAGSTRLVALVETALGVMLMRDVLSAPRVDAATLGLADLAVDLGTSWDDALLETPALFLNERTQLSLVSRALRREPPYDAVWLAISEEAGFAGDVALGRRLGCQGKFVIHPRQIDPVNAAYAVSEEERARAQAIVDAYDAAARAGKGALMLDGMLVDEPVVVQARAILARSAG
jgi:citrate lyase subunit beta/citryl-CoA lyase